MTIKKTKDADRKTAVITGGAGGLGKSIALELARVGYNIAILDFNPQLGAQTQKEISAIAPCLFLPFDITAFGECSDVLRHVYDHFGRLDVLVNNAGLSTHRGTTETIKESDWDTITNVNLKGAFFMAQAAAPFMRESGGGSIVNIASIRGYIATGDRTIYAVTKKALHCLTAELATDFWRYGIRVNSVSPGYVLTEMTSVHLSEPGWLDNQLNIILTDSMPRPEDIAEVAAFLASDESIALSGADIPCECGALACRGKLDSSGL